MVAPSVIWTCLALVSGSTLFVQNFLKPRPPIYSLKVRGLPVFSQLHGRLSTKLRTDIMLHNDNYLKMDVHAIIFDIFYMGWDGTLQLIANIKDENLAQHLWSNDTVPVRLDSSSSTPALWEIAPKSSFESSGDFFLTCFFSRIWATFSRLLWSLFQGGGSILVPMTGVAYIKASAQRAPVTISIICDNQLHAFSMHVQGVECSLKNLQPGWSDVQGTVNDLRQYATTKLKANATGGVLQHPKVSWGETIRRFAFEEILQIP